MFASGNLVDGAWIDVDDRDLRPVMNPWTGETIETIADASPSDVAAAIDAGVEAPTRHPLTPYERYQVLSRTATGVAARREELARTIAAEAGKPVRDARGEVDRAVRALELCAEESKRLGGEVTPVGSMPGSEHRIGFTLPAPVGLVCAVTSFNAPLIQIIHKAPAAIAAGCAVVLKPSEKTPLTAIAFVEILLEAGLPPGWIALLHGGAALGDQLIADPRFAAYTFTGSARVGQHIRASVGMRKTVLELGNNSPSVVHSDADLDLAVEAVARSAFFYGGQMCVAAQRAIVHETVIEEFLDRLARRVALFVVGDPLSDQTDIGPLIDAAAVTRIRDLLAESVTSGARVVPMGHGDFRDGAASAEGAPTVPLTVLADVTPEMRIAVEEAFGPVLAVMSYRSLEEAATLANGTPYGLQAAVFTESIDVAMTLCRSIVTGTIMVNDGSHVRLDQMPFGGVKDSGLGREGIRYAVSEFSAPRLICLNLRPAG